MPEKTDFYVVLDANVLVRDFWMSGEHFSYLRSHQFLGHRLVIPEVAFLEVENTLRRRAEELLSRRSGPHMGSASNARKLKRLFNLKRISSRTNWDVDKLVKRWRKHAKELIEEFNGKLVASPEVELREIVQRSIERRKPFSQGDRGFRDTLIWLSTLRLIDGKSRISFVTENRKDFFAKNSNEPHPEILEEAKKYLGDHWKMLFHPSLEKFISFFDHEREGSSEALHQALISETYSDFSVWQWLEKKLPELLIDEEFDGVEWAGLPIDAEAPRLHEIEDLVSVDIPRLHHLHGEVYRFYCDTAFVGKFQCCIAFGTAEEVVNPRQIVWKDESDDAWTELLLRSIATFILRIDLDISTSSVVTSRIRPLRHWSSYDENIRWFEEMDREDEEWDVFHRENH